MLPVPAPVLPVLIPLAARHARDAARLHMLGQPGTFLTSLGDEVLTVLYRTLPATSAGFGYAIEDAGTSAVLGFVSAANSVGRLFVSLGIEHALEFAPPLAAAFVRAPSLLWRSAQTLLYPLLAAGPEGHDKPAAELLSIMVEPELRSRGLGAVLVAQLVEGCRTRGLRLLDVSVDAANAGAQRFYARHGFAPHHEIRLHGRSMLVLRRVIDGTEGWA